MFIKIFTAPLRLCAKNSYFRNFGRRHRTVLVVIGLIAGALLLLFGRPTLHLALAAMADQHDRKPVPVGQVDDASHLNAVAATVIAVDPDPQRAERQVAELLRGARQRHVSIAGTQHSMGGHTIYPDGVVLDMKPFDRVEIDAGMRLMRVQAGARWSQVIPKLDAVGLAVRVMQSDADFSVGGSLSVNCHGWQPGRPPIAADVRALRVMLADGGIVRCSRTENSDLFARVLGGYGLFGVILEAELEVVPNVCYRLERLVVPADDYPQRYRHL